MAQSLHGLQHHRWAPPALHTEGPFHLLPHTSTGVSNFSLQEMEDLVAMANVKPQVLQVGERAGCRRASSLPWCAGALVIFNLQALSLRSCSTCKLVVVYQY